MTMIKAIPSPVRSQPIVKPEKSCEIVKPKTHKFAFMHFNCIMESTIKMSLFFIII